MEMKLVQRNTFPFLTRSPIGCPDNQPITKLVINEAVGNRYQRVIESYGIRKKNKKKKRSRFRFHHATVSPILLQRYWPVVGSRPANQK